MEPLTPKIVLAVGAHPDDIDYLAGGTVARFAEQGAEVHYLVLTDGSKGTPDKDLDPHALTETRHAEQQAALQALGCTDVTFLNYVDGELEASTDVKRDIVAAIRRLKPDVVITIDPTLLYSAEHQFVNHSDHRAAGLATVDAVYPLARNSKSFPEQLGEGEVPHITQTLLLANFDGCNYHTDITPVFSKKIAAVAAHLSQFENQDATANNVRTMAQKIGKTWGCDLAESFVRIDLS